MCIYQQFQTQRCTVMRHHTRQQQLSYEMCIKFTAHWHNSTSPISTVPSSDATWRRSCFDNTWHTERIRGARCAIMRYINLHLHYIYIYITASVQLLLCLQFKLAYRKHIASTTAIATWQNSLINFSHLYQRRYIFALLCLLISLCTQLQTLTISTKTR